MEQMNLGDLYTEIVMEEGMLDLDDFLQRVQKGEWGSYERADIEDFLGEMEATTLENMGMMLSLHPHLSEEFEERELEQRQEFERLRRKYAWGDMPSDDESEENTTEVVIEARTPSQEEIEPSAISAASSSVMDTKEADAERVVRVLGMVLGIEPFSMQEFRWALKEQLGYSEENMIQSSNDKIAQDLADALRRLGFRLSARPAREGGA